MLEAIRAFDLAVLNFLQSTVKCAFLDPVMAFFSYLGEKGIFWIAIGLIMLFFKRTRATGLMLLCAMLLGFLIGEIGLKNIIDRARPFTQSTNVVPNISLPSSSSFPSGHSASSAAAAAVLVGRHGRYAIPAVVVAALIAFSRLYNYVHYPSDVICGIILGTLCALMVMFIFKKTGLDRRLSPAVQTADKNKGKD